ncbi:MAG: acyltransferase family protein [Ilumatobacteraceae bacterium]
MRQPGSLPYLPSLDGLRAVAVISVIIYHANKAWLGGGFLGVEVFFVISGYLITTLLVTERATTGRVSLKAFWLRRARRLLPALWTLLLAVTIYCALFERDALGALRGDVIGSLVYGFNWFQIWFGSSYFSAFGFVPLRHLWSLAVEEQFYFVWPLVMLVLLKAGRRYLHSIGLLFFLGAVAISIYVAAVYQPGAAGTLQETPKQYLSLVGHPVLRLDYLFLGTLSRAGGLLIGAALAMFWRPWERIRPGRPSLRRGVDVVGLGGIVALGVMMWKFRNVIEGSAEGGSRGYDLLYRGGFLLVGLGSIAVITAAVYPGRSLTHFILDFRVFRWIGLRSYGLYLYHWPIFQFYRHFAGKPLNAGEFGGLMLVALIVTGLSYRYIEMPVRTGALSAWWNNMRNPRLDSEYRRRRRFFALGSLFALLPMFALVSMATAEVKLDEIAQSLKDNEDFVVDVMTSTTVAVSTTTLAPFVTTIPAVTTTVLDGQIIDILAIGDSVMLGAADILTVRGIVVDALKSRPFTQALEIVNYMKSVNRLGEAVIIHLGTNNYVSQETLDSIMVPLADVPIVLFLTTHVPEKPWQDPNNKLLNALPEEYGNVKILDWYAVAEAHPEYLYHDEVHLNEEGQQVYSDLILQAIGR